MADRTSAGLFGRVFKMLAANPTDEHKKFAVELLAMRHDFDFSIYQMDADDALLTLGVAENYEEDGEIYVQLKGNL